jgi:hypothetical protein
LQGGIEGINLFFLGEKMKNTRFYKKKVFSSIALLGGVAKAIKPFWSIYTHTFCKLDRFSALKKKVLIYETA